MGDQATLLIVDDLPTNIRLLTAVLEPHGYTILAAGSGAEALAQVAARAPDMVLLDVVMPGMDGYAVCRRLRDDPATAHLPVVMITASGEQEKLRALEAGADDFIVKPLDQAELLARIRSLLRIKRYHDTIAAQAAELSGWAHTLEARVEARTHELEEARAEVLALYRELGVRNQDLYTLVERLLDAQVAAQATDRNEQRQARAMLEELTPRERDVLRCVAQGQTNAEVARTLVVSPATVKFHMEHIIAKLGVADRTQAAVRAVEYGLLSDSARH